MAATFDYYLFNLTVNIWSCVDDQLSLVEGPSTWRDYMQSLLAILAWDEANPLSLCDKMLTYDGSIHMFPWMIWSLLSVVTLVLCVFVIGCFRLQLKLMMKVFKATQIYYFRKNNEPVEKTMSLDTCSVDNPAQNQQQVSMDPINVLFWSNQIYPHNNGVCCKVIATSDYLQQTVDPLLTEVDKILSKYGGTSISYPSMPSAPRSSSHGGFRRSRLSVPALSTSGDTVKTAWIELDLISMGWTRGHFEAMDYSNSGYLKKVRELMEFGKYVCEIKFTQWNAACLVVNYTLLMLEKELKCLTKDDDLRFEEYVACGSARKGFKVGKPDQFDVLMVMQSTKHPLRDILWNGKHADVKAGRLVLIVDPPNNEDGSEICMEHNGINGSVTCLSSKYILLESQQIVDNALQNILSNNSELLERLPFKLRRSASSPLSITIETRNLNWLGFGMTEMYLKLIPSVRILPCGWFQNTIYAVPKWPKTFSNKPKTRSMLFQRDRNSNTEKESNSAWSMCLVDFEEEYLKGIERKFQASGLDTCPRSCLQILKGMMASAQARSSAVSTVHVSYYLETVFYYLLLESSPQQWTYDMLPSRVSDCINFLLAALSHQRLPSFFVKNVHLLRQMPHLQWFPSIATGAQENLFFNMKPEVASELQSYIKQAIKDSGLHDCIKSQYSSDMWEYEFFIFN